MKDGFLDNGYSTVASPEKHGANRPEVFSDDGTPAGEIAALATGKPHNVRAVLLTLAGAIQEGATKELADICRLFAKEHEAREL